jgi:hypothetical protein
MTSQPTRVFSDEQIAGLLDEGILDPTAVGLKWIEVRYFGTCHGMSKASPCQHTDETRNQYVTRYVKPSGHLRADYEQIEDESACTNMWATGEHGPEGIAAEYEQGGTVSYLSDDPALMERIFEYVRDLMCLTCGAQTWPVHADTAHAPNWCHD